MKNYTLRKNFKTFYLNGETRVKAALAFKTIDTHWVDTELPCIILVSIHSIFNENLNGHLKMNALVSTIKSHVKGRVTILFAERAHINAMNIEYNHLETTVETCLRDAQLLHDRFKNYFNDCQVAYWFNYICNDSNFETSYQAIQYLYQHDSFFKYYLDKDATASYNLRKTKNIMDKSQFIKKTIEDILEQCACVLVLSKKGYRFQFYPGQSYASIAYVNQKLLSKDHRVDWINVFISIEKKTILNSVINM
jgi:hypothetical protein